MTRLAMLLALMVVTGLPLAAQAVRFEVVSVKPNNSVNRGGSISAPGGSQFHVVNIALRSIINYAYNVRDVELVDAPDWIASERFDITASYPAGAARNLAETRLMMQAVLAERFGLRVHRATRELPIYRLVTARDDGRLGPNLVRSEVDCVQWLADKKSQIIGTPPLGPGGARPACMMVTQRNYIMAGTKPIHDLARGLEFVVGRIVVDATGLAGNFDMSLQWTPAPGLDVQPNTPAPAGDAVSLFAALQEQFGLKLEAARGPADVLVIDSIQRPTPD